MHNNDPGNPQYLHEMHTDAAIAERIAGAAQHSYLGDFVLGAVDGTVTTFAIVAGTAGAGLSGGIALLLGIANVLADGLSMAASNYLKTKAEHENLARFRRIESMHIDKMPTAEKQEIREIYAQKGFDGEILNQIVDVISSDRTRWIDTMLTEEWGLQLSPPNSIKAAGVTFVAFVLAGVVPLLPLFFYLEGSSQEAFLISSAMTAITFFGIGYARGVISQEKTPVVLALETLLIGGAAALTAFLVGGWLDHLAK